MVPILNNKWGTVGRFIDYANTQFDKWTNACLATIIPSVPIFRETPNTLLESPHAPTTHSTPILCFPILAPQPWDVLTWDTFSSSPAQRALPQSHNSGEGVPALHCGTSCLPSLPQNCSRKYKKRPLWDHLMLCMTKRCKKKKKSTFFSFYRIILYFCSKFWDIRLFPFTKILHLLLYTHTPFLFSFSILKAKLQHPNPMWKNEVVGKTVVGKLCNKNTAHP